MSKIKEYANTDDQQMILELNQELMRAAAAGNLEAVQKLVLRGADIYFRDHQGDTALSLAITPTSAVNLYVSRYFASLQQFLCLQAP